MVTSVLLLVWPALLANDALLHRADVKKAMEYIKAHDAEHLALQIRIAEIPAPTFHEAERARFLEAEFKRLGLKNVGIDKQGNVLGWRPGKSEKAVVIAAHLDISFPKGVDTKVKRQGKRLLAPGIADDSRGLAAMLAIVEALDHAKIETSKTLLFVANVGEEGLGDLNGVRYLFQQSPHRQRLESFISIDGTNPAGITSGGTAVKRFLITLKGPGGHSYGNFGRPNAIHVAGRIVAKLAVLEVPRTPRTTYNVGKIGGGTVVNAIAEICTMEVDLRSESPAELDRLESKLYSAVRDSVKEENEQRAASKREITSDMKVVSFRPGGQTVETHPLIQSAKWAVQAIGKAPSIGYGSTDSNLPISLGIPAVTLGGGGRADNKHSLDEWYESEEAWLGPQMVMLTVLAYLN